MKIKFIRRDMEVNRKLLPEFDSATMFEHENGRWYWRTDVEFDQSERDARLHVGMANAVPVDAEAEQACRPVMRNWEKKLIRREALARGIAPEDLERFESGELLGYDDDGNDILAEDEDEDDVDT